jgi:hypothetical protein
MTDETITTTGIAAHGASRLPWVEIDSFNLELKDEDGLLGDRANKAAFWENLEEWRKPLRKSGEDPFGNEPSENISKKDLDAILAGDDAEASAVVHSAVEDFAQELVHVTRRFLKTKTWDKTERIAVGGGFRDSRLGELAIAPPKFYSRPRTSKSICCRSTVTRTTRVLSARYISLLLGFSKRTILSLPSTSGARTSGAASWKRVTRRRRTSPRRACGNPSYGVMPMMNLPGRLPSSSSSNCSKT